MIVCRYYSWSPESNLDTNLEYVPMLWGQKDQDEFAGTINQTISNQHISAVLGMNEYVFTHILILHKSS